jgi:hypothetical protein
MMRGVATLLACLGLPGWGGARGARAPGGGLVFSFFYK